VLGFGSRNNNSTTTILWVNKKNLAKSKFSKRRNYILLCKHLRLKTHNFISASATLRENNKCAEQNLPSNFNDAFGKIKKGFKANILILDKNPLENLEWETT